MDDLSDLAIDALLTAQEEEFASGFDTTNYALCEVTIETPEEELLRAGSKLVGSSDPAKRILGIRLIQELKEQAGPAISCLTAMLFTEKDEDVFYWIVNAFGFLDSSDISEKLIDLASRAGPGIRYHAATALVNQKQGDLTDDRLDALITLCADPDAEVRFSAVFELGTWWEYGTDPGAEPVLARACRDKDPLVARTARSALGRCE